MWKFLKSKLEPIYAYLRKNKEKARKEYKQLSEEPKVKVVEVEKEELKAEELNDSEVKEEAE